MAVSGCFGVGYPLSDSRGDKVLGSLAGVESRFSMLFPQGPQT